MTVDKMFFIWGEPTLCISTFNKEDGCDTYLDGSVAITQHWDGDLTNAGSLNHGRALYLDKQQVKDLIVALKEICGDSCDNNQ